MFVGPDPGAGRVLNPGGGRVPGLAVADLKIGSVILPRDESQKAVSRLAEFDWFHKIDSDADIVTPQIDDLLLRAQQAYQAVDGVVKGLGLPPTVGILEILFKGTVIKKKEFEIEQIQGMVADLEARVPKAVEKAAALLEERASAKRSLEEYSSLRDTLAAARKLGVDLAGVGTSRHFYAGLFTLASRDVPEAEKSLDCASYRFPLESKESSALLVVADARDAEKISKTMRAFNASQFSIPEGMPQVPSRAWAAADAKATELSARLKSLGKEISSAAKSGRRNLLAMHEAARTAKEVLETLRKPGGTRNFAVIRGYIPERMESKFVKAAEGWTAVVEDVPKGQDAPTLIQNKRFVRTFEVITQSQGIPKRGEADPTPMIALMWPIFYGIMFADLGHGLLLMGMGLLFKAKGQGTLSRWGMLIAISGAASAIAGVGTGEVFGYHLDHLGPFEGLFEEGGALYAASWIVGVLSVAELSFDQVIDILKVSLFLGIIHLVWAMVLRIRTMYKRGQKLAVYTEALPNLTLYGGIVVIMMCAIGAQYDVMNMYSRAHAEPVPWVTIFLGEWAQVWIVTRIAVVTVLASMVTMIIGGILHTRKHPEDGDPASVLMEVLLAKTIESLAHTISYARLGIMLLVHAALLLTVNNAYVQLGGASSAGAIAMIVGGNLGIMMIEGLIVYIQALRLHLYEFFTKWYSGGAAPFRQVSPEAIYNKFVWRARRA